MKEAIVSKGPSVTIKDSPIPEPKTGQILIKVAYSGSNPKDWKVAEFVDPHNSGDDIAGIVEEVGDNVFEFKKGDRVAAFHQMFCPHGSFAEYAIAWSYATFHLPKGISFEEAATIPLAAMTAAVGLYLRLELPQPWTPALKPTPLVVYGGSGAVGAYVIKLAQASNIHPIIAVAGKGADYVETLITRSRGDTIVDYRKGDDAVVQGIKDALSGYEVKYAFDAVSEHNSFQNISKVLAKEGSKITLILSGRDYSAIPSYIEPSTTTVGIIFKPNIYAGTKDEAVAKEAGLKTGGQEFALVYYRLFARGLQEGWFKPHPYEVIPGGLNGVEKGLSNLKNGLASAVKYIFKIEDTE